MKPHTLPNGVITSLPRMSWRERIAQTRGKDEVLSVPARPLIDDHDDPEAMGFVVEEECDG